MDMTKDSDFVDILKYAVIDHRNKEIQDITSALEELLNRLLSGTIKIRSPYRYEPDFTVFLNFELSQLQPCGSQVENTSIWKSIRRQRRESKFIEFDYLAVLRGEGNTVNIQQGGCLGCSKVFLGSRRANPELCGRRWLSQLYERKELCSCVHSTDSTESEADVTELEADAWRCDNCTAQRDTGRLQIAKLPNHVWRNVKRCEQCSLVFYWISNNHSLLAPNIETLQLTEEIKQLVIRVDLLPAFEDEVLKRGNVFVIPRKCSLCADKDYWMVSHCLFEIETILEKISVKHRNCFIITKFLFDRFLYWTEVDTCVKSYHVKVAFLKHCEACLDDCENYTNCIKDVLQHLLERYVSKRKLLELPSFHGCWGINVEACKWPNIPTACILYTLFAKEPKLCHSANVTVADSLKQTIRLLLDGKIRVIPQTGKLVKGQMDSKATVVDIIGMLLQDEAKPLIQFCKGDKFLFENVLKRFSLLYTDKTGFFKASVIAQKLMNTHEDHIQHPLIRDAIVDARKSYRRNLLFQETRFQTISTTVTKKENSESVDAAIVTNSDIAGSFFNDELQINWKNFDTDQMEKIIKIMQR